MSVCELKEHHTDATETVNNLCNKLRQRCLQLLNTDVAKYSVAQIGTFKLPLIWKVSKPSLVRQIHLSVWFLSAGASQNNRSRKIKELDKKVRHKSILTGKLQA
ncbi:unnamed protein product [Brassica napus]|uniref:(rape) hypothetical protein n=1 Tax=Brassica napus TaxID=3708 RepID=A0A816KLJ8_BRANA|nr:unnamed protein product [Brassica napus]